MSESRRKRDKPMLRPLKIRDKRLKQRSPQKSINMIGVWLEL